MTIRIRKRLTKKELIFNIISLIAIIVIGLYFGIRSFYYYGRQNSKNGNATTLAMKIINSNKISKEANGFSKDEDGYYFKGKVDNNYVKFANRYFRVVRVNNDDTVKLVSEDNASIFMWGEKSKYKGSNLNIWLNKTKYENSGVYYKTIPNINKFLVKTKYKENKLKGTKINKTKNNYSDYITTLTIDDYLNTGKNSYLNNNKCFWLIGNNKEKSNLYVNEDGQVDSASNYETYGVRAVITMKKNVKVVSGIGTKDDPIIINQENNNTYVDQYIKLGNDTYKVYKQEDNVLNLVLTDYIKNNGIDYTMKYSNATSEFNSLSKDNIAYYLNTTYYNSLPYKDKLLDMNNYIGEISNDTNLDYKNIFNKIVSSKVGIMNIFDYNSVDLTDYYLVNTTSSVGNLVYVYNNLGIVDETTVTSDKKIVPTISISKDIIKSGDGTKDNPYIVE